MKDILGKPIEEGSRIACAFRRGNSSEIRVGEVLGVGVRHMLIRWEASGYGMLPAKPTIIFDPERCVVLS